MKKSITIRIPEPCHEDWAKMTPTEKGKFCNVCTKEIFDFTSKTDEELVKILSKNKNACGRIKKSQLNREVKLERKSGTSLAPFAASLLVPLTLFSNNPKPENTSISEKPMISLGIGRYSHTDPLRAKCRIKGIVRDENGNPIKNVEITSNESKAQTWTDKNGEYEIYVMDREWLTFRKENFEKQVIRLRKESTINVLMVSKIGTRTVAVTVGKIAIDPNREAEKDSLATITKGTVTDDSELPLPGVNVVIKGTSKGTQTDFDGNYKIETKPGDVLVFSYVGFETKEITVSNISNSIAVQLNPSMEMTLGIVVVGEVSSEEHQPPKDSAWKEKAKTAYKNTKKFRKLKQERKKAARKARRSKK
jgi:hypothetical protein